MRRLLAAVCLLLAVPYVQAGDANRLTYLDDGVNPYYPKRDFAKLTTPQWVGEEGVEAVVILAIDDMRDSKKYEDYLRPVLNRLKKIDGRAPVSIMTCRCEPDDPQLQTWLKEGVSLEAHTWDHPCPLLGKFDLAGATETYDRCVDQLFKVPNNKPVAFRMPCCDSLNTLSPRFYAEIFNKTTAKGNFLQADSSVFNLPTEAGDRFRKYLPQDRGFYNTIEDYPYPYVIGRLCWEFPCAMPSDWQAQHLHKPNNPITVQDWKEYLDITVRKQGVMTMVFHPHGWIKNEQIVELIDYAVERHGKKVKFLNFKEAVERLNGRVLLDNPLRHPETGRDNGVRLLDVNNDGYMDAVVGNGKIQETYVWSRTRNQFVMGDFPVPLVTKDGHDDGAHFGVFLRDKALSGEDLRLPGPASVMSKDGSVWHYTALRWDGGRSHGATPRSIEEGRDRGVRLRDVLGRGVCQVIVSNDKEQKLFSYDVQRHGVVRLDVTLPTGATIVDAEGKDNGLRFVDIDADGFDDIVLSNEKTFAVYRFHSPDLGWSVKLREGTPGQPNALPLIVKKGRNNGAWFHSGALIVQNEDTAVLKDLVARVSFKELKEEKEPTALSPEQALKSIKPRPGFTVEQTAAEPLVQSPIAFAWGPDGKLWVVEMGDYPLGIDGKGKAGGRVKFLEDTNGDGKYVKATVFLDNLAFPTGVMPWRNGVLVTCAPDILYAEDTKGTGKADKVVKLYSGFREGNQQHRVNSLVWGLDNWIHCANGDSGGTVKSAKTGTSLNISGRDVRIRPDSGAIDLVSGQTQYGRSRDDWNNWFGNNNSWPLWHYALDDQYIRRNAHVAAPDGRVQVSVVPGASRVYPISRTLPRFNDPGAANHFTSACSAIVYRDELFGSAFSESSFVSEPVHNLIHREVIAAQGTTFTSKRAEDEQESEFLASIDNWFRPTMIQTGPDGALWVADMYRAVIEHPEWIPKEWQDKIDLRAGADKGRLYRVYPKGNEPRRIPRLDKLDTAGLVAALDSPSGWQRDMAQMMLLWRADKAAIPLLEKLAVESKRPLARVHALCTLDGLDALTPAVLEKALDDAHPGVRRHAIRLCDTRLATAPQLGVLLAKMVGDKDANVRLQLAYTLGEWDDLRAGKALGQLAVKDAGDRFISAAVMSSVNEANLDAVLIEVLTSDTKTPHGPLFENLLRMALAMKHSQSLAALLKVVSTPEDDKFAAWQFGAVATLLDTLAQRSTSLTKLRDSDDKLKPAVERLAVLFAAAREKASKGAKEEQLLALRLLGRGFDRQKEDVDLLAGLLVPQSSIEVQAAAAAALGKLSDPRVPELLVAGWKGFGPALRGQVFDVLLAREDRVKVALDAVEKKIILPAELEAVRRQRLIDHKDPALRARAAKLLADAIAPDRQKVVDAYQPVLKLDGDAARGGKVFVKTCAVCHRLGDVGHVVGPDLASVGDKSPQGLLIAILDPNRVVEARYVSYIASMKNGQTFNGVLSSETGNSITLLGPDGKQQVILRNDLDELISTGKSLMPEGLEKDIAQQEMADLIAYVRSVGPVAKRKTFEGNKPETVRPAKDGSLLLTAANGEIFGKTLVLEMKHGNLGFWVSDDDHVAWTVELPKAGRYELRLEWACEERSAGKTWLLQTGTAELKGKVESTGTWDDYKTAKIGEVLLAAGSQRLTMRSVSKLYANPLMDLKSLKLVPVMEK